jgi:chromosome segregation ATPase
MTTLTKARTAVTDLERDLERLRELAAEAATRARAARAGEPAILRAAASELAGLAAIVDDTERELVAAREAATRLEHQQREATLRQQLTEAVADANTHADRMCAAFVAAYDAVREHAATIVLAQADRQAAIAAARAVARDLGQPHALDEHVRVDAHLHTHRQVPRNLDTLVAGLLDAVAAARAEAVEADRADRRAARAA